MKTLTKSSILMELKKLILALEKQNLDSLTKGEREELDDLLEKDIPRLIKLIKPKEK
jgi:hypothetical protein